MRHRDSTRSRPKEQILEAQCKAVQIILQSRAALREEYYRNSAFALDISDNNEVDQELRPWKDAFLSTEEVLPVVIDVYYNKRSMQESMMSIDNYLLEQWTILYHDDSTPDGRADPAALNKELYVLLRTLCSFVRITPTFDAVKRIRRNSESGDIIFFQISKVPHPAAFDDRASISEFRVATSPNPAGELSVFVSYRSDCNFSSRLSESIPHTTMQSMGSSDDLPSSHSPHTPVLGDLASSPPSTVVIDDYDPSKRRTSRNVTLPLTIQSAKKSVAFNVDSKHQASSTSPSNRIRSQSLPPNAIKMVSPFKPSPNDDDGSFSPSSLKSEFGYKSSLTSPRTAFQPIDASVKSSVSSSGSSMNSVFLPPPTQPADRSPSSSASSSASPRTSRISPGSSVTSPVIRSVDSPSYRININPVMRRESSDPQLKKKQGEDAQGVSMFKSAPQPPTSGSTKFGSALLLSQQPLNRDRNRLMSDAIVSEPVLNPARGEQISGKSSQPALNSTTIAELSEFLKLCSTPKPLHLTEDRGRSSSAYDSTKESIEALREFGRRIGIRDPESPS